MNLVDQEQRAEIVKLDPHPHFKSRTIPLYWLYKNKLTSKIEGSYTQVFTVYNYRKSASMQDYHSSPCQGLLLQFFCQQLVQSKSQIRRFARPKIETRHALSDCDRAIRIYFVAIGDYLFKGDARRGLRRLQPPLEASSPPVGGSFCSCRTKSGKMTYENYIFYPC